MEELTYLLYIWKVKYYLYIMDMKNAIVKTALTSLRLPDKEFGEKISFMLH